MASSKFNQLYIWISALLLHGLHASALPSCPHNIHADYDFVVVGAGVGGGPVAARLAESGFSVLVVDAGHDVVNVNTTIPLYFARALEDPQIELNYTYSEYSAGSKVSRDQEWYPRARALGGSTIHNALLNIVGETRGDFDNLAAKFNDPSWSYDSMRAYFKRIEHNLYFDKTNPDHGFDGWLKTSLNPTSILADPKFADPQLGDIVNALSTSAPSVSDINSVANDAAVGVGAPSYTADENHNRSSIRDHLRDVEASSGGKLTFAFDTLATKVALCSPGHGQPPRAYGVAIAPGAALAVASNFHGKRQLTTKLVTVRYEVIVSAGVFQSPQLLMLSGIGDRKQLVQHNITPIVHLPGVGTNLQDHDEVSNIWTLKQNHTLFNGCTLLSTPEDDPCLAFWTASGHQNLYSFGAALIVNMSKSSPDLAEPDVLTYWSPGFFRGFFQGVPQEIASVHNALTAVVLKAHPASRGVVRLTGNHPQDPLRIEKRHFEASGGKQDMVAIRETIKVIRDIIAQPDIGQHIEAQVFPAPQVQTDEEIESHILEHVFGHHACCTAPMGTDDDPNAVLDGNLKVRGVENLRVVDISSWPIVPGWFVTTPTYMLAEKAADVIIAAAQERA